jgi:hypothetical protein
MTATAPPRWCCRRFLAPAASAADSAYRGLSSCSSLGCSSCPPANAVRSYRERVMSRPVVRQITYWDGLGWKDVWPQFTSRQWDYTPRLYVTRCGRRKSSWRANIVGTRSRRAINRYRGAAGRRAMSLAGGTVTVNGENAPRQATSGWCAADACHRVRDQEYGNGGRTPHHSIVANWSGSASWNVAPAKCRQPRRRVNGGFSLTGAGGRDHRGIARLDRFACSDQPATRVKRSIGRGGWL